VRCCLSHKELSHKYRRIARLLSIPANGRRRKRFSKTGKLRTELIRLYRSQQELNANAQSDSEKAMVASLLDGLEQISRSAHEEAGFTYAPLAQLEALQ